MTYRIETLSAIEKQIFVQVPRAEVDIAIDSVLTQKQKNFKKKGFREDRVPMDLIYKEQKSEVLQQATEQVFSVRVKEAQKLYQLVPLNQVQIQTGAPMEKGKDFEFSFIIEILPDLDIPDATEMKVNVKNVAATEADIDHIISAIQEEMCKIEEISEKRLAVEGEIVEFDFESLGEFAAAQGMSGQAHRLQLGTANTVRAFETVLYSMLPGETKTVDIPYPDSFPNTALAGKTVKTTITLKKLFSKTLPTVDDTFARNVARVDTVLEMRAVIGQRHNQRLAGLAEQDAKRQLLDGMINSIEVPLSKGYLEKNMAELFGNYTMAMRQRGMKDEEIVSQYNTVREQFSPEAEAAAKRQLFLLSVAKKERMKLTEEEIQQELVQRAALEEKDVNRFVMEVQQAGMMRNIKDDLMMRKVMEMLYQRAEKVMVSQSPA